MRSIARVLAFPAVMLAASAAFAQAPGYAERGYETRPYPEAAFRERAPLAQQELDQILAPVALYPDSLLSQLLMAAAYPRDVAEAARWSRAHPGVQGDDAVRAVEREPWDPSVKSMVAFPEILAQMGDRPDWSARLGAAFLASEEAVMRTVQDLRHRADAAGNLRSDERILVERAGEDYVVQPASPETVYVPYYDPRVVYGDPWWPNYQPVYWNAWPGYAYIGGIGFGWGRGISLRRDFFYGGFDWRRGQVRYAGHRPYYFSGRDYSRGWRHDGNDGRRQAYDRSPSSPRYFPRESPRRWAGRGGDRPMARDTAQRSFTPGLERSAPRNDWVAGGSRRFDPAARTAVARENGEAARVRNGRNDIERSAQIHRAAPTQRAVGVPRASLSPRAAPARQRAERTGDGGEHHNAGRGRDR